MFACSLVGGVLSWTDQGASRYYVRQVDGGVNSYVGATAGLSLAVDGDADSYIVLHWVDGERVRATCPGR